METQERQHALEHLAASEARMLTMVEGLTPAQWNFKESPERWSIAENVEHCVLIEKGVLASIQHALAKSPQPERRAAHEAKRAAAKEAGLPVQQKLVAPDAFLPQGRWADTNELIGALRSARATTVAFATETEADLHARFFPHFMFGDMDCYEWLTLMAHHIRRHVRQIERVKADPAYPA